MCHISNTLLLLYQGRKGIEREYEFSIPWPMSSVSNNAFDIWVTYVPIYFATRSRPSRFIALCINSTCVLFYVYKNTNLIKLRNTGVLECNDIQVDSLNFLTSKFNMKILQLQNNKFFALFYLSFRYTYYICIHITRKQVATNWRNWYARKCYYFYIILNYIISFQFP